MGTLASPGGYALEDLCEALIREYLHRKGLR